MLAKQRADGTERIAMKTADGYVPWQMREVDVLAEDWVAVGV